MLNMAKSTETLVLDSFSVLLHSPNGRQMPAIGAVHRDCQECLRNVGNCHVMWANNYPECSGVKVSPCLYLARNTSQWEAMNVSYTTDSPTATMYGLCSSPLQWLRHDAYRVLLNMLNNQDQNKLADSLQTTFSNAFYLGRKCWNSTADFFFFC